MKKYLDILLVTSLGAGFSPIAPGTAGALVGVFIWLIPLMLGTAYNHLWTATLLACVVVTLISIRPIGRIEKLWGHDPSRVVIDETVGVWICLLGVPRSATVSSGIAATSSLPLAGWVLAAFLLFRFFDIAKPLGIRRMERYPGGWGVMADDILSGLYGLILMSVAQLFLS